MISGLAERMPAPRWRRIPQFCALFAIPAGGVLVARKAEKRLAVADRLAAYFINQHNNAPPIPISSGLVQNLLQS